MAVLVWVAIVVAVWCVASVVTALALGTWLRHRREATDPQGALRPLETGPVRMWLDEVPDVPATPDEMGRRGGWDALDAGLPEPRSHSERTGPARIAERTTIG